MLHHLASRQLAVEISILKYLNLVSDCSGLYIVSISFCSGSACVLGSFKRPCSLSLAAQHVLLHAVTKENKQPVMWSSAEEFFPCSPPFPPLDYIWYASSRSTSRTCIPKKLWWHTPAPSFFGLLPVVMVTPGSEMAFHSGESSPPPHSLLPSSDQKPHFRQPKILYLPHTALFRRACWLQGSSHWQDLYAVAAWRRPVQYQAMSGLLVQMSPCCTDLFLLHWKKKSLSQW